MMERPYSDLEYLGPADQYLEEILEIIHDIELFQGLSMEEISALSRYLQCFAAPRDYTLLEEGADGEYLLLILSGDVAVKKKIAVAEAVQEDLMADVGAGATVGEVSLVDGKPRFISCVARTPVDFAVFSRQALNALLLQSPRLANKLLLSLLALMSTNLRDTFDRCWMIDAKQAPFQA